MPFKNILGLDIGTASIGWAVVKVDEENPNLNTIIKLGVRVVPITTEDKLNFEKGKSITLNADRTLARSIRRNLHRYKLRRKNLIDLLIQNQIIAPHTPLNENGKFTTFETLQIRAKAAKERIGLNELARVLLHINKKRGYKSSRKVQNEDEGKAIDGMAVAKLLYKEKLTPGQYVYQLLKNGKNQIPNFYRSDLQKEWDRVWDFQKQFYPDTFTEDLKKELEGKGQKASIAILYKNCGMTTATNKGKKNEKKLKAYEWRSRAISERLSLEEVAYVLAEINNNIYNSSGYLGAISDKSKELFFNCQTVGENLYTQISQNEHTKLKNQVFLRQDYADEFDQIWETQAQFHPQLTSELRKKIRDSTIFYQRKLRSQKGLISICEFENREIEISKNGKKKTKTIGLKVAPKSSPLFQEFKIWQILNNVLIRQEGNNRSLTLEEKELLFSELNTKGNLPAQKILALLKLPAKNTKINYTTLEGNRTQEQLYRVYFKILEWEGHNVFELLKLPEDQDELRPADSKLSAAEIKEIVRSAFESCSISSSILDFDALLPNPEFERQHLYQLWHLLYSYEGDNSPSGNEKLLNLLQNKFGFKKEHAQFLTSISFASEYGNLSTKAMRNLYPYSKENSYSDACVLAGYRHSKNSLTREELANRKLKNRLEILPKNSLRNPVVEKIINQLINLVNSLQEEYGAFDEIHLELARDLKKNAQEREKWYKNALEANSRNQQYSEILKKDFGISNPSRNDIIRYRLYLELNENGFKDLYTQTYVIKDLLFTNKYDIDHIIPQSKVFDDSFSNKVLVPRKANHDKGNLTAMDYVSNLGKEREEQYLNTVSELYKKGVISYKKYKNLVTEGADIGDGFLNRDLNNTQYIARKTTELLNQITPRVVTTTGEITAKLRKDWNLVNTMKELNIEKFHSAGLTEWVINSKGEKKEIIKDWNKRSDHRHHAMDALTIAFTTSNHIQYLNYLNARDDETNKKHFHIISIEKKVKNDIILENGKRKSIFTFPTNNFRQEAKKQLNEILVSHKVKNKVVTVNQNKPKKRNGYTPKDERTPRGPLHKETIYGMAKILQTKEVKISSKFNYETVLMVQKKVYRDALLKRLEENLNDPKKAFSGKNSLAKNPISLTAHSSEKVPENVVIQWYEKIYTIRKPISPDNFKNEKTIEKVLDPTLRILLKNRLREAGGNAKEAFSDLEKNPIWLNKEKGICVKTVTIRGISNAESLHIKKDHFGNEILDEKGNPIPVDFVSTGNNHHVAIYKDAEGALQEKVVSFFEAVEKVNQGLPVIDTLYNKELGWKFLFTMKQNEMFLFPSEDFNPNDIDLYDNKNLSQISKHLFRVQKLASKDYHFRHHLETSIEFNADSLRGITWRREGVNGVKNIVKIRLNHLGKIVHIGE